MKQIQKTETIIYGGAFNPPTRAHVAILRACFEHAAAMNADIWIMPSGNRTDKVIPVSRERRLAYIDALIQDATPNVSNKVRVDTSELDREISVETIDTLRELEAAHPGRRFTFIFGADSTETMATWSEGELLLATLPMFVIERAGSRINPRALLARPLNVITPPVSSTQVRAAMQSGAPLHKLVTPSVARLLS